MILTKSAKGYSHIKSGKPCQDYSASYHDDRCTIITVCDGHGGDIYVRSDRGSRFASIAFTKTILSLSNKTIRNITDDNVLNKIKLNVLCEWNNLVSEDLRKEPLRKRDYGNLSESEQITLKSNPIKAYGTTLLGAAIIDKKIIAIQIGDGGAFFIQKNKQITPIFEEDEDDPVANITYSMCQEDAYDYINILSCPLSLYKGIILCSDGLINPYQSYENFQKSFVKALLQSVKENKSKEIINFIKNMAKKQGNGDDVSIAYYLK